MPSLAWELLPNMPSLTSSASVCALGNAQLFRHIDVVLQYVSRFLCKLIIFNHKLGFMNTELLPGPQYAVRNPINGINVTRTDVIYQVLRFQSSTKRSAAIYFGREHLPPLHNLWRSSRAK